MKYSAKKHKEVIENYRKKQFGEVFTPIKLINEMLDTLPKEVWSNPKLKWGDFCVGYGNFPVAVVQRLMEGLKGFESDAEKRYKHIMENMIYVCDINLKNMFIYNKLFNLDGKLKLNYYRGSFLDKKFDEKMTVWDVEKFDIIVGNPPYQTLKGNNKKSQPLWHLFVQKNISILSEGGYMCIIHPGGWRNVAGVFKKTQELLKSKEMLYLKLHNFRKGQEIFNAAITFDYYTIRNKENEKFLTKIVFEDDKEFDVDISTLEFIPNESFDEISKLIAKEGEEKVNILHSYSAYETRKSWISKEKTDKFKYPAVYTVKSPDKGNIPTCWYSNKNNGHIGISKVIWANGASGVFVDKTGEYGLTQFAYAIVDDVENLENIKKALQTEKFIRNIMGFKNSLGDKYNRKIISTFRKDFWKDFMNDKECTYSKTLKETMSIINKKNNKQL